MTLNEIDALIEEQEQLETEAHKAGAVYSLRSLVRVLRAQLGTVKEEEMDSGLQIERIPSNMAMITPEGVAAAYGYPLKIVKEEEGKL